MMMLMMMMMMMTLKAQSNGALYSNTVITLAADGGVGEPARWLYQM